MPYQPRLVRTEPDPERPINRQVYSVHGTEIRSKSVEDEDIVGYRWNTKATIKDFLLAHLPLRGRPPQIAGPFRPVRLFEKFGEPVNSSKLRPIFQDSTYISKDRLEESTSNLFESLGTVELASTDNVVRVHWLNAPDKELLGDISPDNLHTFVLEIDRKAHDETILAWYLDAVRPATVDPIDPAEISTYLSDDI
jgi:hypothetical protein